MSEASIIPALILQIDRLIVVAEAAERTVTRLTHPTIDPDAVPGEIIAVTLRDLDQALAEVGEGELEGIPAVGDVWSMDQNVHGFVHETSDDGEQWVTSGPDVVASLFDNEGEC